MPWTTFREVFDAFTDEREERQGRGGAAEQQRSIQERDAARHQFLAVWPARAKDLDPLALALGSWAFQGELPPYVPRTSDGSLARRLDAPGITVVVGPPKSGKSRSIFETLKQVRPDATVWWANPTPTILPDMVAAAKEALRKDARRQELPGVIVLDDAGLIGADPSGGLTAQRLNDLAVTGAHILIVLHEKALVAWDAQIIERGGSILDIGTGFSALGVTKELMDLLGHRIRYETLLDGDETIQASAVYNSADGRVKDFNLARLAETLAGVDALRKQAHQVLANPVGVDAALLEAVIDATIAFPTGATLDILAGLAKAHWHRRQPNRPWRPDRLDDALDILTTGLNDRSPHAILTTTDHTRYRLFDALIPELQQPDRDTDTITEALEGISLTAVDDARLSIGFWHYTNRRAEKARKAWSSAAESGSTAAMSNLGALAHDAGDIDGARQWWSQSAQAGRPEAMYNLGVLADEAGDMEKARRLWVQAAKAGNPEAMWTLYMLAEKAGATNGAHRWLVQAARTGHPDAMSRLGLLAYKTGNMDQAHRWLSPAARAGQTDAMFGLGALADDAGDVDEAHRWWVQAAEAGNAGAMNVLGHRARRAGDTDGARTWWGRAAQTGLASAMNDLGILAYETGDMDEAHRWWLPAAQDGHPDAMIGLGAIAKDAGDSQGARQWWVQAAEAGHRYALVNLGVLAKDVGDTKEARQWWVEAARGGNLDAMFYLGILAEETGDLAEARRWWAQAAEAGHAEAKASLDLLATKRGKA